RCGLTPTLHGLAVPFAQRAEPAEILVAQIRVPVGEILHRIVEPFLLVLGESVDHAAAKDVTEQLVTGLIERGRGCRETSGLLLAHLPSLRFTGCGRIHRVRAKDNHPIRHGAKVPKCSPLDVRVTFIAYNRKNFTRVPEGTRRDTWPSMTKCTTST